MKTKLFVTAALAAVLSLAACDQAAVDTDGATVVEAAEIDIPEGFTLVERVEANGDDIVIPYSEYELDNGLKVILHQDTSDPIAHVDVTYHVGSGREDVGRSGFAHFFEHMMFQGSENVADEEHFKIVSESGGTLNGTTNGDRTNYFQTVPSNQLEKMLWLEADRMGYFLDAVTQEKFEVQRETVKNERGQRVDNQPYGRVFGKLGEATYPEGHPYSWSTIGYLEDLDRATLNDLKKFFLRWYGPNNATLTIGGDIDEAETLRMVKKYFGPIPRGPEVRDPKPVEVRLEEDRYISYEDNVQLPAVVMNIPTVYARHPDEAPLDVLVNILGQGETSLLYRDLVKPGLAVNAQASHGCRELSCSFQIFALPNPAKGQSLADLEAAIRSAIAELGERGVQQDDLDRVKAQIKASNIFGLESVAGKVRQLAAYETFEDNANLIGEEIARYERVTADDVMRVYDEYIRDGKAVILSVVPEGGAVAPAAPDTWSMYERDIPELEDVSDVDWSLPLDDFDRSVAPPAGENPSLKPFEVYEAELANGIDVLGTVNDEVPTTQMTLRFRAGQAYEPLDKLGLAALTAAMLNEATTESTQEELSNRLDKLGSSVSVSSGDSYATVSVRSLTENLDETLAIAMERLLMPAFDEADFARVKDQTLEGIRTTKKEPGPVANESFARELFGDDNAFAYLDSGTVETVETITLDDVRAFYASHYAPSGADVVAVSSLSEAEVVEALAPLAAWESDVEVAEVSPAAFPELEAGTIYFVDKPGAAQSEIRIGTRSLPYDATGDYYVASLVNFPLGGAFNSRINLNLREDKGYTYGARAGFVGQKDRGYFVARAGVRTDATTDSIREFLKELEAFGESGPTDEEISFTKSAIGQSEARNFETPRQKAGILSRMATYDLDPDYLDAQKALLGDLTREDAAARAAELIDVDDMIIVVVGDKASVMEGLQELGRAIVELDVDGNRVGNTG